MKTPIEIPSGLDHLRMLSVCETVTLRESSKEIGELSTDGRMIGTALSSLYQAATCHRKCSRGPHILEALCGRMYNLGVAAYILMLRGFYDEALNLTRGIGEVSNLIALSVVNKNALQEWISSDKKTRLRKFSPSQVRKTLGREATPLLIADETWYSRFCETYSHVTPQTKPNMHNKADQPYAGGVFQYEGLTKALDELATVLGSVALIVCEYFQFSDLSEEILALVRSVEESSTAGNG